MNKACTKCGNEKDLNYYNKHSISKDGLSHWCKDCTRIYGNEYRKNHRSELKEKHKQDYANNPDKFSEKRKEIKTRFNTSKGGCKRRHLSWHLTFEQYSELITHPCYYCNNLLGGPVIKGCGLDRMNCSIGYIYDNCVSCCYICNTFKSDKFSVAETKAAVEAILRVRGLI